MRVGFSAQRWRMRLASGLLLSLVLGVTCQAVTAATVGERYFVDFRARPSSYIGHTFVIYGRRDANGRVIELHYAGLIPERDVWHGIFAPIRATVRQYKDDTRLTPNAIYHRSLTEAEYRRMVRTIALMRSVEHEWHAVFFNCNDFGIQVAEAVGLRRPPSLLPPNAWVTLLRKMNEPGQ